MSENNSSEHLSRLTIKDWSAEDRPREKFLLKGESAMTNAELIAILFRSGMRGKTALDIAKELIQKYPLEKLIKMTPSELKNLPIGIKKDGKVQQLGISRGMTLAAAFSVARRIRFEKNANDKIKFLTPQLVFELFHPIVAHLSHEEFHILLLDIANTKIKTMLVTQGILNASLVHPREVFKEAIIEKAASIVLVHNHPSGNPEPSAEDIRITKQLVDAGKLIDIRVQDHIIIAGERFTSFAERALL